MSIENLVRNINNLGPQHTDLTDIIIRYLSANNIKAFRNEFSVNFRVRDIADNHLHELNTIVDSYLGNVTGSLQTIRETDRYNKMPTSNTLPFTVPLSELPTKYRTFIVADKIGSIDITSGVIIDKEETGTKTTAKFAPS